VIPTAVFLVGADIILTLQIMELNHEEIGRPPRSYGRILSQVHTVDLHVSPVRPVPSPSFLSEYGKDPEL
jgi:hypothetical protein